MDIERIRKAVKGKLYFFDAVNSTNAVALESADAPDKSLFLTENQLAGRGRYGRRWEASEGGIYMTVLVRPQEIKEDLAALTLATGLAVSNVIKGSVIKWPNDIILGDKKVAGILLETGIDGKTGIIAAGIGINANNSGFSREIADKATSIRLFSGKRVDETELVINVYEEFLRVYERFLTGFDAIKAEYAAKCVTLNREIEVIADSQSRRMYAVGISDKGELLAEENGKTVAINFGDVSVRGIMGYC